jgi:hypothetical protein
MALQHRLARTRTRAGPAADLIQALGPDAAADKGDEGLEVSQIG